MTLIGLRTPYYRKVLDSIDIIVNEYRDNYKLFALRTQMWDYMKGDEYAVYRSESVDMDTTRVYMYIMLDGNILELPPDRYNELQNVIDNFFNKKSNECLVYRTTDERVLAWPFPDNVKQRLYNGRLMVDLSSIENYSEVYDIINIGVHYSLLLS